MQRPPFGCRVPEGVERGPLTTDERRPVRLQRVLHARLEKGRVRCDMWQIFGFCICPCGPAPAAHDAPSGS
eukprot:9468124-Pyramimonas_sp.AAC.1